MQPARPVGNGEHQAAPDSACHGASPRAVEDSATPREEETEGDEEGGGIVVDNTIVCVGCRCERWRRELLRVHHASAPGRPVFDS